MLVIMVARPMDGWIGHHPTLICFCSCSSRSRLFSSLTFLRRKKSFQIVLRGDYVGFKSKPVGRFRDFMNGQFNLAEENILFMPLVVLQTIQTYTTHMCMYIHEYILHNLRKLECRIQWASIIEISCIIIGR